MSKTKQSDIFLSGEGDAYFERNASEHDKRVFPGTDRQALAIVELFESIKKAQTYPGSPILPSTVLEIGCGEGSRLEWISKEYNVECSGIDPSKNAINLAKLRGIDAKVATAEELPFESKKFDVVLFGHCLYLCDPEDLFKIAAETDRVLKNSGWVIISDFYSNNYVKVPYRHQEGVFSHKMDYRKIFEWHPHYTCMSHKVGGMPHFHFNDTKDNWISVSILRKN